jgi:hypothetical protein
LERRFGHVDRFGAAVGVIKGKVYVVSGATSSTVVNNNEIYNPAKNTWTTGASIPTARFVPASAVANNILYVIGGTSDGTTPLSVVEAYDPVTNAWSTKASLPTATDSMYAVSMKDIIYVVGGYNPDQGRLATLYSYNPATDSWTRESSMNVPKSNPATGVLGGIVAAGGTTNAPYASGDVTDNEIYNTSKNVWKTLADIPTARTAPCFGVTAGSFYVASGGTAGYDTPVDVLEAYSGKTKAWTSLASIPQAVVEPASAVVGGRLYCIGGGTSGYFVQGSTYGVPYGNVQIYQP